MVFRYNIYSQSDHLPNECNISAQIVEKQSSSSRHLKLLTPENVKFLQLFGFKVLAEEKKIQKTLSRYQNKRTLRTIVLKKNFQLSLKLRLRSGRTENEFYYFKC